MRACVPYSQPSSLKIELGDISWKTYADGFPNVFVEGAEHIRGKHVAFLASFNNPQTIFEQISVIYSLPKMFIASFTLILPFFPTGTAERVEKEGEVPTAVTLARILSHIPLSRGGPTSTIIFDIHALQERFYFGDNITPCFETGVPLLLLELAQLEDVDDVVIAYPDEGAMKRFHTYFEGFNEVVCTKVRQGDKRLVTLKEGDPQVRRVIRPRLVLFFKGFTLHTRTRAVAGCTETNKHTRALSDGEAMTMTVYYYS